MQSIRRAISRRANNRKSRNKRGARGLRLLIAIAKRLRGDGRTELRGSISDEGALKDGNAIRDKDVGLTGLEPVTLRLSSACSNQLSYRHGLAGGQKGWVIGQRTSRMRVPLLCLPRRLRYRRSN